MWMLLHLLSLALDTALKQELITQFLEAFHTGSQMNTHRGKVRHTESLIKGLQAF